MSTIENYLSTIRATNDRMWAQVKPLEKQLRDLDTEYQAAIRRPITDVVSRGAAALLLTRINATVAKINAAYDDWQRTLSLITPPPPTINPNTFPPPRSPGKLSDKIPWPKDVPLEVRRSNYSTSPQTAAASNSSSTLSPMHTTPSSRPATKASSPSPSGSAISA